VSRLHLSLRSLLRNVFSVLYVAVDVPCCPEPLYVSGVAMPVRPDCQLAVAVNEESQFQSFKTSLPARGQPNWSASLASATDEVNTRVRVLVFRTNHFVSRGEGGSGQ
jgi:hypothetical protein